MAVTLLGSTFGNSVSSLTITGVTAATGDVIAITFGCSDPFTADGISSIAWSGESFTVARAYLPPTDILDWQRVEVWYLVVASGDTADVSITLSASVTGCAAVAVKMTSMDTGSLIRGYVEAENSGQSPPNGHHEQIITTVAGDVVLSVIAAETATDDNIIVQAGQTELYNGFADFNGSGKGSLTVTSYEIATGTSTQVGYDFDNQISLMESNNNAMLAVAFKVSAGAADRVIYNPQPLRGPLLAQ